MRGGELLINLTAVEKNYRCLQAHLPEGCKIAPVIKANGYGLGAKPLADFFQTLGVQLFVVLNLEEAKEIAPKRALVLHASSVELEELIQIGAEIALSTIDQLKKFLSLRREVRIHLHLNSGMNRLGLSFDELLLAAKMLEGHPEIKVVGLMSHFAASDLPEEDDFSKRQMNHLKAAKRELLRFGIAPETLHIANSFGAIRLPSSEFNMVRIGLALYGIETEKLPLEGALTLSSTIVQIHTVEKGESVSYGRNYVAKEKERIAVIPIGYYDGVPRSFSNRGAVLISGEEAPIVGTVCMDFFLVNVTPISSAQIGSRVTLFGVDEWGNRLSPEEAARKGETIAHELIARLGPRILRRFESHECPVASTKYERNVSLL